jgi:transposase
MNQTAEGLVPAAKGGHDRDVWEERILAQYSNRLHKFAASCDMDIIRAYDGQITKLEAEIIRQAKKDLGRDYHLLLSVPGIGRVLAMTLLFEIDTIERFPTVKDFLSYCRLVKGSVASAGKLKGLTGGKMGNAYLRWAFGQAAVIAKRNHPLLTPYTEKLTSKHGKFKGNAILANKLARAIYFMLQNGTAFDAERVIATSI